MRSPFRGQRAALLLSIVSLSGFLLLAFQKSSLSMIDNDVNSWTASIHTSSITLIAEAISYSFDTTILLVASLLVAAYLLYKGLWKNALLLVGGMGGIAGIITLVKSIVHSPRPLNGVIQENGFSFPSGHVTSTVVFFGLLTYFAWQHWKTSKARTLTNMFYAALEFLVGFSRMYLNVHWLSDVLGGYLLGAFWLTLLIWLFRYSTSSFQPTQTALSVEQKRN